MPISGPDVLLCEKKEDGRIWVLTLNRPERMNALSVELIERLETTWQEFGQDDSARVAVITAAGDAFCTGMDMRDVKERREQGLPMPKRIPDFSPAEIWKPVICAINGVCMGGGMLIAHDCDIRIAAENAQLGVTEAQWNMPASWIRDLTRLMHLGHALELVLWGDRTITAQRAYEMGLVNRVVPKEKLMEEAMSWAERMLYLAPRAVRNFKEIIYRGFHLEPRVARIFGQALEQNLQGMEDSIEGMKAFAEKRKPQFKNK